MELEMKDSTGEVSAMRPIGVCGRKDAQGGDMGTVGKGSTPQTTMITGGANSSHRARASSQRGLLETAFPAPALNLHRVQQASPEGSGSQGCLSPMPPWSQPAFHEPMQCSFSV